MHKLALFTRRTTSQCVVFNAEYTRRRPCFRINCRHFTKFRLRQQLLQSSLFVRESGDLLQQMSAGNIGRLRKARTRYSLYRELHGGQTACNLFCSQLCRRSLDERGHMRPRTPLNGVIASKMCPRCIQGVFKPVSDHTGGCMLIPGLNSLLL